MNPNREELLFQLALTKPAAEQAAWLDRECGSDAALRARLEASLVDAARADSFFGGDDSLMAGVNARLAAAR